MSASPSFFTRRLFRIHAATWIAVLALFLVEGYIDLPHPYSVPFTVFIVLVALPFIIIPSFRAPAPDISAAAISPKVYSFFIVVFDRLFGRSTLLLLIMCMAGGIPA